MKYALWIVVVLVIYFLIKKFLSQFKVPKVGALALVTGGVKTGKSTLAVAMVMSEFKKRTRSVRWHNAMQRLFRGKKAVMLEYPLIYSNVPLAMPYVPVTKDLLLRKKRFVYGSVVYLCEESLVADSQLIKDMSINEQLLLFHKLIGHETKGGCVIVDTQSISDVHYSLKRTLSEYIYIHHLVKWIPFFLIAYVQEYRYSEDNSVIGVNTQDNELTLRKVIVPKSTWKKFDCYTYSVLTDNLDVENNVVANDNKTSDLKARKIVSFRPNFEKYSVGGSYEKKND